MTETFAELLTKAGTIHASEIHLRQDEDGPARIVAMVRGDAVVMAEFDPDQVDSFMAGAFSACDGADLYHPGTARMMRLTGERLALPKGVSQVLMQFLPKGGARQLVSRIAYEGDVCCGSCGGGA